MSADSPPIVVWAAKKAETFLTPLKNRWLHVQGVVERSRWIGPLFNETDREILIAAAYLHDIGYAPELQQTQFHPIDGARYLYTQDKKRLASLVAYHSESPFEAQLRGLTEELAEFPREHSLIADALTYCDMTTNGRGQKVTFQERLEDIYQRYNETHIVSQAIHQAEPSLTQAIERTQQAMQKYGLH